MIKTKKKIFIIVNIPVNLKWIERIPQKQFELLKDQNRIECNGEYDGNNIEENYKRRKKYIRYFLESV